MCAINGIFAYHYAALDVSIDELLATRDAMASRGPDGSGRWICQTGRVAIGHRRLAILDLSSRGRQPMHSSCDRYVMSFNGEIYNYRELRSALVKCGSRFRSACDSEVLLELYRLKGAEMLRELRGMFAMAIWDKQERSLFLARDPLGIKPLYFSDDGWTFRFASQVKALIAGGAVSRDPNVRGQTGFYLWGAVPDPCTIYRDVQALPAGNFMVVNRIGQSRQCPYFSVSRAIRQAELAAAEPVNRSEIEVGINAALRESVACHLLSDVPVGIFLSGGIDSGAVAGLMRDCSNARTRSVTLRFEEFAGQPDDEGPRA